MKKSLFIILIFGLITINTNAQISYYSFSQASNTFDTLTTGNVLIPSITATGTCYVDSTVTSGSATTTTGIGLPIGFTFTYNGSNFDVFGINSNGWISFGQSSLFPSSVNMNSFAASSPINTTSTASAVLQNRVSVFGRSLAGQTSSQLSYATLGTAPDRVLVVEWKKFRRSVNSTSDNLNFQIRLYETTNIVEFVYGTVTYNGNNASVQVGLRGQANTDYNNRTSYMSWATTTAGYSNIATISISSTVYPASGLTYIFTPLSQNDAGISALNSLSTSLVNGLKNISVTIKNFGSDTLTNSTIAWSVNNVLQTPYSWSGLLAHNVTNGPDTIGIYNFSTPGIYTIKAWTENPNGNTDQNNINDTTTKIVYVKGFAALPFSENFDQTWIISTFEVPSIYWVNSHTTGNSSWRRYDDGASAAWSNSTSGAYTPAGAGNTAHSARFHSRSASAYTPGVFDVNLNFTPAGTKILKFWHINTSGNDSLNIYFSSDSGATFGFVQKIITDASWTLHTLNLGTATSPKTIIRFKAVNVNPYSSATDIGLDSVQVYIQPDNDMAAISWLAPVNGCGHTASDTVTIKIANAGASPQSNIPVYYTINGGQTITGPETIAGPVNPGDTINYTFTQHADFSVAGQHICKAFVGLSNDLNHLNDSVFANIVSINTINAFPFVENFNNPAGTYYFILSAAANAGATLLDTNGVNNTGCASFTGFSVNTGWSGTGTISAAAAYGTYTSHHATLYPCHINATGLTNLRLKFDLKQEYYSQRTYTWLVLIANGTDTLANIDGIKYYNPTTTSSDPFTTKTYDLSAYAGTSFTLEFKSACKYNVTAGTPGNNNYIDNIIFFIPPANDAGVTALLSPISSMCGNANDSVIVVVKNYGVVSQSSIPVEAYITTPTGNITLTNTLTAPLAPNATDTIKLGNINTTSPGNYYFTIYTQLANDTIYSNDTLHSLLVTNPILSIPHVEDYEVPTPLANWNATNFLSGNGHSNNSNVMYATIRNSAHTGSAYMNKKTGPVTTKTYLSFEYRIVNSNNGNGTLLTTDSVLVLLSSDCGITYDTLYVIDSANHVISTSMKKIVLPIASYTGTEVLPGFYVKRGITGNYFLDIDNVAISDAPVVNLGPDTGFCPGSSIVLNAGDSAAGYTYTYVWSTLLHPDSIATTQTITVDSTATYIATVNNGLGITATDTIVVGYFPVPVFTLGHDTTNCNSYILDPGAGYSSYTWSTGAHTQTINATSTGTYWADVTNVHGCMARDSVHVIIIPLPTVYAGPSQSICYLDTFHISNSAAANYDSLLWTSSGDGHFNDSTLLHAEYILGATDITNGTVTLTLTAYAYCDTVSSTVVLTIVTAPVANAGPDDTICSGESIQLTATGGTSYMWNTGAATQSITVAPITTTIYTVTVTSSCGTATDNVMITVDNIVAPNLGSDTILCDYSSIILHAGAGYDSYLWSTGATTQTITVDTTGTGIGTFPYWVEVTNGVCTAADTIHITFTSCVGTTELSHDMTLNLFPNPTTGLINIAVNGPTSHADLTIYTLQGMSVFTDKISGNSTTSLDLSFLPKGVYVIRIYNEKTSILSKLIIQ